MALLVYVWLYRLGEMHCCCMFDYTGMVRGTADYVWLYRLGEGHCWGMFGYTSLMRGTPGVCLVIQVW